jgi:hypothetical protein
LHEQAYEKFCVLEKKLPGDGRVLYFKAVSACCSGKVEESEKAFDTLCTIYPDAEVGKYYLQALRARKESGADMENPSYFYCVPQAERDSRCKALLSLGSCEKDEAELLFLVGNYGRYLRWCFDEMDGADHDLQYLAIVTAIHVRADDFIREMMLDHEVLDALKVETLRMLYERNENTELGAVLCHAYRKLRLYRIEIGRKRHKRFVSAYARIAARFVGVGESYGKRLKTSTEKLYRSLEEKGGLDLVTNTNDLACAIFLFAGFKELGADKEMIAKALEADFEKVQGILNAALGIENEREKQRENTNETD